MRSPASASMEVTRKPRRAREADRFAVAVVLPTPPLPEVITTVRGGSPERCGRRECVAEGMVEWWPGESLMEREAEGRTRAGIRFRVSRGDGVRVLLLQQENGEGNH